jgi:hypothetical protein
MVGYHVTTRKKVARYVSTGCILEPVRFWSNRESAVAWMKKTGRDVILAIPVGVAYPLPDHKPRGHAFWTDRNVRNWFAVDCCSWQ